MSGKRQWLEKTRGSEALAVIGAILEKLEVLSDYIEREPSEIEVDERILDVDVLLDRVRDGRVELRVRAPPAIVEEAVNDGILELDGKRVTISIVGDPDLWGVPARALYEKIPRFILRVDGHIFKQLAFETSTSGVEFMAIYTKSGSAAFFEGEHYRVSLPFVRALASVHTHPEGSCMLSIPDIQSGLDLLVEGGFFEAAATPSCAAVMYRVGFVDEEDYVAVKEYLLRARKSRRPPRMPNLKSIVFAMLAY